MDGEIQKPNINEKKKKKNHGPATGLKVNP